MGVMDKGSSWQRIGVGLALALVAGGCSPAERTAQDAAATAAVEAVAPPAPLPPIEDPDLREALAQLEAAGTREERLEALDAVWMAAIDDQVVPYLAPWIRHEDPEVAIRAVEVIEQLSVESERALPVLRQAVTWPLPREVKLQVLGALFELRTDAPGFEVAQALLLAFADPDPTVRAEAAEYAGLVRDPEAIGPLRERLAIEPDARVREKIEWSIAFLRDEVDLGAPPSPSPILEEILQAPAETAEPPSSSGEAKSSSTPGPGA
jgi:HEAT repeat protein